jgi:hypothetical protein
MKTFGFSGSRRFFLRQTISLLILGAIIAIYVKRIDNQQVLELLPKSDWVLLSAGYVLILIVLAVRSMRWAYLLAGFNVFLSYADAFLMYLVEVMFSSFLSALSPAVRALYLGNQVAHTAEKLLFVGLEKIFDWLIPLVIAVTAIPYLMFQWGQPVSWISLTGLLLLPFFVRAGLVSFEQLVRHPWPSRMDRIRARLFSNFSLRSKDFGWQESVVCYSFSLVGFALYYTAIFLISRSFFLPVNFRELIMIDAIATFSVLVPLNFAGISTRDVAVVSLLILYGCSEESASLFALALIVLRFMVSGLGWIGMSILRSRGYVLMFPKRGGLKVRE